MPSLRAKGQEVTRTNSSQHEAVFMSLSFSRCSYSLSLSIFLPPSLTFYLSYGSFLLAKQTYIEDLRMKFNLPPSGKIAQSGRENII